MPGVGVDVVGAEAGLVELGCRIAFPDRPLPRTEHADAGRAVGLERRFPFLGHDVECLVPTDRRELAVFVVFAVLHAQQRLRQAIGAVHDLRQEVTFDAVQAAIDLRIGIALCCHHPAILHADQYGTTRAAEAADTLVPANGGSSATVVLGCGHCRQCDTGAGCCGGNGLGLDELSAIHGHGWASWQGELGKREIGAMVSGSVCS